MHAAFNCQCFVIQFHLVQLSSAEQLPGESGTLLQIQFFLDVIYLDIPYCYFIESGNHKNLENVFVISSNDE